MVILKWKSRISLRTYNDEMEKDTKGTKVSSIESGNVINNFSFNINSDLFKYIEKYSEL